MISFLKNNKNNETTKIIGLIAEEQMQKSLTLSFERPLNQRNN